MERSYWLARWEEGKTGFHQEHGCADLREHWSALEPSPGERVLVPLCGKSRDLLWLAEQGHAVVGVEFSELAGRSLFAEHDLVAEERQVGPFLELRAPAPLELTLLVGDFFALTPELLGPCRLAYDRAAVVALPPELRPRYLAHLASLLAPAAGAGTPALLIVTIAYAQEEKEGPPFSVPLAELEAGFGPGFSFRTLVRRVGSEVPGPLGKAGLSDLEELVLVARGR